MSARISLLAEQLTAADTHVVLNSAFLLCSADQRLYPACAQVVPRFTGPDLEPVRSRGGRGVYLKIMLPAT
jgi:hypothetical protein